MTVLIKKLDSADRYNWRVQVGEGRGARIKSKHFKKVRAKGKARKLAKERGDVLKEQMQWGGLRTVRSY